MVMSAPVPDWIADVMRDCRSLALIVSRLSVMPVSFWHSCVICPLSSTSEAGTKSAQRSQWILVPCAYAGARPVARMAASPPVCAATRPAPDNLRTLRRVMRAMFPPPIILRIGLRLLGQTRVRAEASMPTARVMCCPSRQDAPALRASASRYSLRLAGKRTLQYAAHRRMLPVLHLHPILRPAALIRPVAALRHQSLQSHVAGGAKQARTDLTLLEGRDEDAVRSAGK